MTTVGAGSLTRGPAGRQLPPNEMRYCVVQPSAPLDAVTVITVFSQSPEEPLLGRDAAEFTSIKQFPVLLMGLDSVPSTRQDVTFPGPVDASSHDVTALMHAWTAGDSAARDQLKTVVYRPAWQADRVERFCDVALSADRG